MAIVPLFGLDISASSANVTAQQRVNLFPEVRVDADKSAMVLYGSPGLTLAHNIGGTPSRGCYALGNYIYQVEKDSLLRLDNAFVSTVIGTLSTTFGFVDFADNGSQICLVDGVKVYIYNVNTGVFSTPASPQHPQTVVAIAGYFLVNQGLTPVFWKSAILDGLTWSALDFATASTETDVLVRVSALGGLLVLFGQKHTEFWNNTGALNFPFSEIQNTSKHIGLAAQQSVANVGESLCFVGKTEEGQIQVMRMFGSQPVRISTFELENRMAGYSSVANATAFSYQTRGQLIYQVNFPSGGESWAYNVSTSETLGVNVWSQVSSYQVGRHRLERCIAYINRLIGSDFDNGNLYVLDSNNRTDNGDQIARTLATHHYFEDNENVSVGNVWLDLEPGVGLATGQGSDPQVMFDYSKDGGHTWSAQLWRSAGKIGKYRQRARWGRLGSARDFVFRWTMTDPVKTVWIQAGLRTQSRQMRRPG